MSEGLPATVKVGPFDFRLVQWSARDGAEKHRYGECSTITLEIRVDFDMHQPRKAAHTLLHEVLHAAWWVWEVDDKDEEERTVAALSTALAAIWRDNPALMAWIDGALTGEPG